VGFFAQGAVPFPSFFERGTGSAELTVTDRTAAPGASYGDTASLSARFRLGAQEFQVELTQAGFPPPQAGGVAADRPLPLPGHAVEGGVILDRDLHGNSGLGWPGTTRVHAAAAVWGVGRVMFNGELITDTAVIHVSALSHGAQADDETHLTLAQAREGDTELHVLVWNMPQSAEPRGFIQFSFDDVEISLADAPVRAVAAVPNVNPGGQDQMGVAAGGMMLGGVPMTPPAPPGDGVGGSGFDLEAAPVTGTPGGPVTAVSPATISGPASLDPLAVPGVSVGTEGTTGGTIAGGAPVAAGATVGAGAVTPDTISGTFPTTGAPTPAANISGVMPGTPTPGSTLAGQTVVPPGAPPPGGPASVGVALGSTPPTLSSLGSFSVQPLSPPNFGGFTGSPQVSPGIVATPPPLGSDPTTPTPPLLSSPAPLTAAPATPLLGTPAPLTVSPPPALIGTPPPANAVPGAATLAPVAPSTIAPPGATVAPPGGTGVPPSI
jgi:hypothetical protein